MHITGKKKKSNFFFLLKKNVKYFQSQNYKSHFFWLSIYIYADIDTVDLHNIYTAHTCIHKYIHAYKKFKDKKHSE